MMMILLLPKSLKNSLEISFANWWCFGASKLFRSCFWIRFWIGAAMQVPSLKKFQCKFLLCYAWRVIGWLLLLLLLFLLFCFVFGIGFHLADIPLGDCGRNWWHLEDPNTKLEDSSICSPSFSMMISISIVLSLRFSSLPLTSNSNNPFSSPLGR